MCILIKQLVSVSFLHMAGVVSYECPICFDVYNATDHRPMILPSCGHTFCTSCIDSVRAQGGDVVCPQCRARLDVDQSQTNWTLLSVMNDIVTIADKENTIALLHQNALALQNTISANTTEIHNKDAVINRMNIEIRDKDTDINHMNIEIRDLNANIRDMDAEIAALEQRILVIQSLNTSEWLFA